MEPKVFIEMIYAQVQQMDRVKYVDNIFDYMDEHLQLRAYDLCDECLRIADVENLSTPAILAFLIVTLSYACLLNEREGFYIRSEAKLLRDRPADVDRLLNGLKE